MNQIKFFSSPTQEYDQQELERELASLNIIRVRSFIVATLLAELLLWVADYYLVPYPEIRHQAIYHPYLYGIILAVSLVFLLLFISLARSLVKDAVKTATVNALIITYLTVALAWGAFASISSQRGNGSLAVFLVIILLGSLLLYIDSRYLLVPYVISLIIFSLGYRYLPMPSLYAIKHYLNLSIYIVLSWFISRTLFRSYVERFKSRCLIEVQNRLLKEGNRELLEEIVARKEAQERLEIANRELMQLSLIDDLTGIPNRRNMDIFLRYEWHRGLREGTSLSLIMIDIDSFKAFNDHYGHVEGDGALMKVAQALESSRRRSTDFVARYGGEEFLFIALNMNEAGSLTLAELLKRNIEDLHIPHATSSISPWVTISLGTITLIPGEIEDYTSALKMADMALYEAKKGGGNQVRVFRSPQETLF